MCDEIVAKKVGSVLVNMYEETETGLPIFYAQTDNKHMLYVLDTIENALNNIKLD